MPDEAEPPSGLVCRQQSGPDRLRDRHSETLNGVSIASKRINGADSLSVALATASVLASWLTYGRAELSLDEGYTSAETQLSFPTLIRVFWSRELNGGLHTLLMWALDRPGPVLMRLPSVMFMVVGFFLFHRLVRRHFGRWPACAGLTILVTNPAVQQDMVTARTYALTLFLIIASFSLLDDAVRTARLGLFLLWGCLSGITFYAHFVSVLVVAAQMLWLVIYERPQRKLWLTGSVATTILGVPCAIFLAGAGARQGQLVAVPPPSWSSLLQGLADVAAGYGRASAAAGAGLALLVGTVIVTGIARRPRRPGMLGVLAFAVPISALAVGSQASSALFSDRYLALAVPGLALAVAAGVARCQEYSPLLSRLAIPLLLWSNIAFCAVVLTLVARTPWTSSHPWSAAMHSIAGSSVTTALPAEGYLARIYAARYGAHFLPGPALTAPDFLEQSRYQGRTCGNLGSMVTPLWVMSAASPDFSADYQKLAVCLHATPQQLSSFGAVQVVQLVPNRTR